MHKWIIQIIETEKNSFHSLLNILERFNIDFDVVQVHNGKIWKDSLEYKLEPSVNYMVCGSYQLNRYIQEKRKSVVFSIEDYSFENFLDIFGKENFVNGDAKIISSEDIGWSENLEIFIRPVEDTKSFNGGVYNKENFNYKGDVVVANIKNISQEYRFFIIDNKISTSSMYKLNGKYETSYPIDDKAVEFVHNMIGKFDEKCFVIDVAKIDDDYKIVELNGLNSAGFYNIDLYKFVFDIEDYYEKYIDNPKKKLKL